MFLEGDPDKVARIRALLPDAVYTTWAKAPAALRRAIASPPAHPVTPASAFAAYAGVPFARKLGIQPGWVVRLANPPPDFGRALGPLPDGATVRKGLRGRADLVVWFVRSRAVVARGIRAMGARAGRGGLWIAWPKKSSALASDLTQNEVRRLGLALGPGRLQESARLTRRGRAFASPAAHGKRGQTPFPRKGGSDPILQEDS